MKKLTLALLILMVSLAGISCKTFRHRHDNGKHKGWFKNPNNPHHPLSNKKGKKGKKPKKNKGHKHLKVLDWQYK